MPGDICPSHHVQPDRFVDRIRNRKAKEYKVSVSDIFLGFGTVLPPVSDNAHDGSKTKKSAVKVPYTNTTGP